MINKVGILGLGALGGMFGQLIVKSIGKDNLYILGDKNRLEKYKNKGVFINDEKIDFNYEAIGEPLDLLIVATKFHHLKYALESAKSFVNENTIVISLLNGVNSEEVIKNTLGVGRILYCVAYGMDAQKYDNHIKFNNYGVLAVGQEENNIVSDSVKELIEFFEKVGIKYEIPKSMLNKLWSKFMLNVGINQVCAAYGLHYGDVKVEGEYRNIMISAMKEVLKIAECKNIPIDERDIEYWLKIIDGLSDNSMPSMAQDILNKNKTEVEIFGDAMVEMGKELNVEVPTNIMLSQIIHEKEKSYEL